MTNVNKKIEVNMKTLLVVPFFLGLFSLNFLLSEPEKNNQNSDIRHSLKYLESLNTVNSELFQVREKVIGIINRFNQEMSEELKIQIADEIYRMSIKYPNLDVDLICATITHESGRDWNTEAFSRAGAMGLMQIMPRTGQWLSRFEGIEWTTAEEILYDPINNIRLGCRYLSYLKELYGLEGGLAAYNGGGVRVKKWLASGKDDNVLWEETRSYIPFVLKWYDEFKSSSVM